VRIRVGERGRSSLQPISAALPKYFPQISNTYRLPTSRKLPWSRSNPRRRV